MTGLTTSRDSLSPLPESADARRIAGEIAGHGLATDPFVSAVRATRMPMIITNPRLPDNPVVFTNDSFCRLTGYRRDEIIGRNCRFLQGPETDPATTARIRAAVAAQEPLEIDVRNHRKGGEPFWNRLLMAPVRDERGEVAYFFASQVDVTIERERLAGLEHDNAALMVEVAGRLRAQEDSEARLRFAASAGRMGIWELDLQTHELTTSSICRANFGRPEGATLTYAELDDCVWPEDRQRMHAALKASLHDGADYDIEFRVHRPHGATGWVQVRAQVMRDTMGTPIRLAGISLDITARRVAEAELHRTSALLRTILETAPGLIYAKDLQGRMLIANPPTLGLIGKPWDQVQGRTDAETLDNPEDARRVMQNDRRIMRAGVTEEIEEQVGVLHGWPRHWLSTKTPLRDDRGETIGLVGVSVDITARKQAEDALHALNQTLEQRVFERTKERDRTWNNSQDILAVLDTEGVFAAVNPAFTAILGWTNQEVVGQGTDAFVHLDDRAGTADAIVRARDGLPTFENRYRHKDGGLRWIAWVASFEDGFIYASGRHVTAEKEAAAALSRTEEALRQAQKMEAVGQLTGGIAHDFNNLLTGISGSLTLMNKRIAAGQTQGLERYTSAAITSAQRAAALTQRLLAFARRQPLDPRRVEANRLVAEMEDLVRRTLGPSIEVEMVLAGGLWPTLCDPNQLESAILNLVINARDAIASKAGADQGGQAGRLTIETANAHLDDAYARTQGFDVKPGQYVAIAVTDTGTGMPPDIVARAFEPFFTTKPTGQGTGLGLSMLYGFVKQSEGHVRIYSEPGQGTTFKLYLPRDRSRAQDRMDDMTLPEPHEARAEAGETVLVVDDEPVVRMLVVETLEDLGYAAIEAADGNAGLAILQSDARVDLLVTDVGLPGLNGRQLADAGRARRPGLPVLFITGYAHNAAVGQGAALDPGMEIITKPFSVDALAIKIREMIETHALSRP